jgi:soluble lytic murein transglycosylase-like protein
MKIFGPGSMGKHPVGRFPSAGRRPAYIMMAVVLAAASALAVSPADLKNLYDPIVKKAGARHGVDPELIHAIIKAESNYERFAVSARGALGLMQLMPATASHYGVLNVFDPAQNIEGGTRYLKDLIGLYNGQTRLVLAAYNAGQEAVRRYGGIPPYKETRDYIARIQASYSRQVIRGPGSQIYRFYDDNGRLVLTNDINLVKKKSGG